MLAADEVASTEDSSHGAAKRTATDDHLVWALGDDALCACPCAAGVRIRVRISAIVVAWLKEFQQLPYSLDAAVLAPPLT